MPFREDMEKSLLKFPRLSRGKRTGVVTNLRPDLVKGRQAGAVLKGGREKTGKYKAQDAC